MNIADVKIIPSWVKVTRLTYQETNGMLDDEPFKKIYNLTKAFEKRRIEKALDMKGLISWNEKQVNMREENS